MFQFTVSIKMNNLPNCNPDIYQNGIQVFMTNTISSERLEEWVKKIAQESNQPVDWHWAAGRAIILTTGDMERVRITIKNNRDMHDQFYLEAIKELGISSGLWTSLSHKYLDGIWASNGL